MSQESALPWLKEIGLCVVSKNGEIAYQNERCQSLCGEQLNQDCKQPCLNGAARAAISPALAELITAGPGDNDIRVMNGRELHGDLCDVLAIPQQDHTLILFRSADRRKHSELDYFSNDKLSAREIQVLSLVLDGATNTRIARKLNIGKATVKTHLNSIYKKLPETVSRELKDLSIRRRKGAG